MQLNMFSGILMPETCWAAFKWQVINLRICCIWLVDSVESMMMHGLANPKKKKKKLKLHFAGLTRDIDYSDGRFRSQFKHIPGQYLKLWFCRGYFVPIHQLRIVLPFDAIRGVSKILRQTSEVRSPHQKEGGGGGNRINILPQNNCRGRVPTFTLPQSFRFSSLGTLITPSLFSSN